MNHGYCLRTLYIFVCIVFFLTGCSLQNQGRTPIISVEASAPSTFAIPDIRERMIYLARQEWELFGRPEINYDSEPPAVTYPTNVIHGHEKLAPFFSRIFMYWYAATDLPIIGHEGEIRPWSGAFIVWLVRSAGVPESDFPSTVLHWDYMDYLMNSSLENRFVSHPVSDYIPKPGDIICAPRGDVFIQAIHNYNELKRGPYHCDLVVAKRLDELDVIGGNVADAVSMAHIKLDGTGKVLPVKGRPWALVIEQQY